MRHRIGFGARALLAQAGAANCIEDFARHYAQRCGRRGRVCPGAAVTLSTLRHAGVKLALLTNKERRFARQVLEMHGLDGEFDLEICGDSLPARKPDPLPVLHCLRALAVPAAHALLVGDSPIDIRTARAAGITVWAVSYGYGPRAELAQADRVIDRLGEVSAGYAPRASSSSLYLRSRPRNW